MASDKPVYKKDGWNTHLNLHNRNHLSQGDRTRNSRPTTTKKRRKGREKERMAATIQFLFQFQSGSGALENMSACERQHGVRWHDFGANATSVVSPLASHFLFALFPSPCLATPWANTQMCSRIFQSQYHSTERECGVLSSTFILFSYVAKGKDRVCVWGSRGTARKEKEREARVNLKPKMAACS